MMKTEKVMSRRRPTIKDVAALAGLSVGSVSNVFNRPDQVRADTRERVEKAMRELDFVGDRVAGRLRGGRSDLVGVIVPDVGNPFWAKVLRGIEMVLNQHSLALVVSSSRLDVAREQSILRTFEGQRVDGLLIAPVKGRTQLMQRFADRKFGVVTLDRELPGEVFSSVSLDDVRGGELAADHLLSTGHRRIALVNSAQTVSWANDRRKGVIRAYKARRLRAQDCLCEVTLDEETTDAGRFAARVLARMENRPTAIICGNDLIALGVLLELHELGRRVPEDFSLVGYDDVDFAAALSPPLTSVRQPAYEMGKAGATLLVERRPGDVRHTYFAPELIVRESTGRFEE